MTTFLIAILIFAVMMAFLGIGVIFGRRCLRGSCASSRPALSADGEKLVCPRCEKDLSEKRPG